MKIFFIDELQELHGNQKAQKNLLKVLEKKNPDVYFVLGAMDDFKVPNAVKRRAVPYRLHPLSTKDVATCLYEAATKKLGLDIDGSEEKQQALIVIAQNCGGNMGTALSFLERCYYSDMWSEDSLHKELGLVKHDKLLNMAGYLINGDNEFFQYDWDEELVRKILRVFLAALKSQAGAELTPWEKRNTGNIVDADAENLQFSVAELLKLNTYTYVTPDIVMFHVINTLLRNSQKSAVPPRRRRVV